MTPVVEMPPRDGGERHAHNPEERRERQRESPPEDRLDRDQRERQDRAVERSMRVRLLLDPGEAFTVGTAAHLLPWSLGVSPR